MKQPSALATVVRLSATLLIICAVVAAALAGVNAITRDRIAEARQEKVLSAVSTVLKDGSSAVEISYVTDGRSNVSRVYKNENGYAVQVESSGFGGTISMMVGVDPEGNVTGICIISHSETPGLGAVAAQDSKKGNAFRAQFAGLQGLITIGGGENGVDAMSGATVTSQAIVDGVNEALRCVAGLA